MAGARRTTGGKRPDDLRGEFTIVAVPGNHRKQRNGKQAGGTGKYSRQRKAEKQKLLLEARIAGRSWREAAKLAGYRSVSAAYDAGQEAIADIPREAADEARSLEMQRIDEVVRANWKNMQAGDTNAGNLILRAIERRARLLGLDLAEPSPDLTIDVRLHAMLVEMLTLSDPEFALREAEMARLADASQRGADRARRTAGTRASGE